MDARDKVQTGTRILVVEDDRSIARLVQLELEHRRFAVRCAYDGPSGLAAVSEFHPAAVVLDIMLPGLDGVGVLKRLRADGHTVPVIMLTARGDPADKVHSLDRGADDYLSKPFDVEELMARLRALLRRAGQEETLRVADLELDTSGRRARRGAREIGLTAREYDLLEFMARNRRRVLSRDLLLARVWQQEFGVATNVVDVYVGYLRRKVDGPGETPLIQTVRGVGYVLREDQVLAAGGLMTFLLSAFGSHLLALVALSPLEAVGATREIAAQDLSPRLPVVTLKDEIWCLATMNGLLARLQAAFARGEEALVRQSSFAADAGHELCTPLTSIAGYAGAG